MAERRMFAKTIIDSDAFIDMPLSTQALYFHLGMRADDDGFINNPKKIVRMIGASEDDYRLLVAKRFVIAFESGIIVIKHWKIHNYIRGDRKKDTLYPEEMAMLAEKDNGAYILIEDDVCQLTDKCQASDGQVTDKCQHRLGEYRVSKVNLGKLRLAEGAADNGNEEDVENSVDNSRLEAVGGTLGKGVVLLTDDQREALLDKLGLDAFNHYIDKLSTFIIEKEAKVSNHYNTILKWAREDSMV